ncbi:MAG TPA: TolC family protein [Gammaproteobacteria bacterium]|nr:TolC family protein [Gammaproteobacteria bacterium]
MGLRLNNKMHFSIVGYITTVCFLFALGTVQAATVVLDLSQSVERALKTDARISEKEKLVEAARGLLAEARGADDWLFNVNSFVGFSPTLRGGLFETTDSSGKRAVGIPDNAFDIDGLSPWYYVDFSFIKPLHTFGKIKHYSKAAAGNIQVKQGDVAIRRGQTLLEVTRAYNGYLAARDTRFLLEDSAQKMEAALALVQGWLDDGEGEAKQSDLFALQTGVALLQRYVAEAAGFENIALAGLRLLTNVAPDDELELADKRLRPVELPGDELRALQARALVQRPEMRQLAAGLQARREWMLAKKSEANPNLYTGLAGIISYSPLRDDLTSVSAYDPFNTAGATPILGLQWEWASGRQPAQVAQARAEMESTLALRTFAQRGIPFQVAEQYHTVHAHYEMVQKLYEGSRSGRRWMISSYADFEAGVEQADKVISAFLGYIQAYSDYLKTVNDYNLHVAKLRVVTGEIE